MSYADADMPAAKQALIRMLERSCGITKAERLYQAWRSDLAGQPAESMNRLLATCGMTLALRGAAWPPAALRNRPLVIVANHPFGILDGIAALALAERTGRPVKVLINADLLRVLELQPFSLPIDFSETRQARAVNLASGREALARLKAGGVIVIFPAGGIATARWPLGQADDLPWKSFVAKLVQKAQADVVPLYFPGQNSFWFHVASRVSMFWRLSLVVPEALRRLGQEIEVEVGETIFYEELAGITDRNALTALLRARAFALASDRVLPDREGHIAAWKGADARRGGGTGLMCG